MESINFAWCAREKALALMSKAGYEEDTSVIAMAEMAAKHAAPNHTENRRIASFRMFRSSSKFVSNALPRLQGPVKRSGRIR